MIVLNDITMNTFDYTNMTCNTQLDNSFTKPKNILLYLYVRNDHRSLDKTLIEIL